MIILTYIAFFSGVVLHVAAAFLALQYLSARRNGQMLTVASRTALVGAGCLAFTFLLRFAQWRMVPLSTPIDFLNILLLMVSLTAVLITRDARRRGLLTFYLPPLAVVAIIAAGTAVPDLGNEPKMLSSILLVVHVVPAFLAYGLFFTASLTAIAYSYQDRHLKRGNIQGLFQKLPSLENLDKTLYQLIRLGYPLFVVTLVLGLYWAYDERDKLSATWWWSPKIFMSACMVVFYAITFHGRQLGRLRGPKLAYALYIFGALLFGYLLLKNFPLSEYNFWGAGQ